MKMIGGAMAILVLSVIYIWLNYSKMKRMDWFVVMIFELIVIVVAACIDLKVPDPITAVIFVFRQFTLKVYSFFP
jgi:hypothetical protein